MAGRASRQKAGKVAGRAQGRYGVIVARFHEHISKRLLDGALETLRAHGVPDREVEVVWVPGSFELPQAASHLARSGRFDALVCLGVVIRGETPHFEHVAREAASGISRVALATGVPVTFGVITAVSEEQALDRAGGRVANRGEEAALAAIEMVQLVERQGGRRRRHSGG